jgi:mannosyltransferase
LIALPRTPHRLTWNAWGVQTTSAGTLTPPAPGADDVDASPRRPRRLPAWVPRLLCWLVPTALAGIVVGYRAAVPEPWRDEFATWSAATRSVEQILALGQHIDGVTVPYYLLVHGWGAWFGDSILALRMPSIIAMTATVAVAALLARRLWGTRAALLAGLVLAVMPVASRYGQEARGYALAAFFATLSTLLLVYALDRSRWWRWFAYALSVLLLGWSHQVALLLLLGHGVAVLAVGWRRLAWWLPGVVLAAAGVLPFTLIGLDQRGAQLDWLSAANASDLAAIAENLFISGILGGAVCLLAAVALRDRERWAGLLLLCAVLPVLVLYVVDQLVAPMFVGRYLFFVVPLLCVLAGRALAGLGAGTALAIVVVLALIGVPAQDEIRRTHSNFDYRQAAAMVRANAQPGDAIIYAPRWGWQFTDIALHYYSGDDLPRDVLLYSDELHNASLWATECADPGVCLASTDRVWTLSADNLETGRRAGATDQLSYREQLALAPFEQLLTTRLDGFTMALFVRRPVPEPDTAPEPTPADRRWGPGNGPPD